MGQTEGYLKPTNGRQSGLAYRPNFVADGAGDGEDEGVDVFERAEDRFVLGSVTCSGGTSIGRIFTKVSLLVARRICGKYGAQLADRFRHFEAQQADNEIIE